MSSVFKQGSAHQEKEHKAVLSTTQVDPILSEVPTLPATTRSLPETSGRFPIALPTKKGEITDQTSKITRYLGPTITRPLTTTSERPIVRIPAERLRQTPAQPHRRSPLVLLSVLLGSIFILVFSTIYVIPLDTSHQLPIISQALNQIFTMNNSSTLPISQQKASPTPTLAFQTTEGYCGGYDIWGTCALATTASGQVGSGEMQRPINGSFISQPFGVPEYQFWCGCVRPHTGIDLAAPYNTPILAADSGQVLWVGWDWSGLGNAVKISHGRYIATVYGHMASYIVKVGQNVSKGEIIGYEGSSGASTGPHLHFMVFDNNHWVDPIKYVALP